MFNSLNTNNFICRIFFFQKYLTTLYYIYKYSKKHLFLLQHFLKNKNLPEYVKIRTLIQDFSNIVTFKRFYLPAKKISESFIVLL